MYSLRLRCPKSGSETICFELWEAGTVAISESEEDDSCVLIAGFDAADARARLLETFAAFHPEWQQDDTDWIKVTQKSWPGREIGRSFFLAPAWCQDATPPGRHRILHNPGQASGTGEHRCTQFALEALERTVLRGSKVLDVGTGSGILALGALHLGAREAIGVDWDADALLTAKENFCLNGFDPTLVAGSAECIGDEWADLTVANISATVLLSIMDQLVRVTRATGTLILTGFPNAEAPALLDLFPEAKLSSAGEWACLIATLS